MGSCDGAVKDPIQDFIRSGGAINAYLVEPVPFLYERLVRNMAPFRDSARCYNLAIGARDEKRPIYFVSPRFAEDHPDQPHWKKYQIGSLTDRHIGRWIPSEYIEHVTVECVSPATFFAHAGLEPRDLDLVCVDTEGFDGEIVRGFLQSSEPEVIFYEHKMLPAKENAALEETLRQRGYEVVTVTSDNFCRKKSKA